MVQKDQARLEASWQEWLAEHNEEELGSNPVDIKKFSSYKDWATDFSTHPHGGKKASDIDVAKYLYAYMTVLKEWELAPLNCRNLLVTYARWGEPDFGDDK